MRSKGEKRREKGRESELQDGHARFGQTRVVDAVEKSLMIEKVARVKLEKAVELRADFWAHVAPCAVLVLAEEPAGELRCLEGV